MVARQHVSRDRRMLPLLLTYLATPEKPWVGVVRRGEAPCRLWIDARKHVFRNGRMPPGAMNPIHSVCRMRTPVGGIITEAVLMQHDGSVN
jgi:hypothetical protein